jgi:hypothetical protein
LHHKVDRIIHRKAPFQNHIGKKNDGASASPAKHSQGTAAAFSPPFQDKFDIRRILRRKSPFFRVKLKIFLLCG